MQTKTRQRDNLSLNRKKRLNEGVKIWASFYKANLHRLALDYFGIKLYPFQMIMLYMMSNKTYSTFITARGLSKSFTTALYLCCTCVVKPGVKILVSCTTKEQSRTLIKEKIEKELMNMSPNLRREIKEVKTGQNETVVIFRNGSTIEAINASQNTRGKRCHILVVDEYRMIDGGFETLNQVLKPFLNCVRIPPFMKKKEYENYPPEENSEVYISSAWYGDHWSYDHFTSYINKMLKGEDYFTCNLPYQLAKHHGLLTEARVEAILGDENLSEVDFLMEFEAQFYKQNDKAYIKSSDIIPNRVLFEAFYPPSDVEYAEEKDKKVKSYYLPKISNDELRILSCDIALMASSKSKNNDAAVFTYLRSIPKNDKYISQMLHTETIEGGKVKELALRIKRLFYDGQCDYIVLDCQQNGIPVLDELGEITFDKERNITYPAMKCFNETDLSERCGYKDALPVIYGFRGNARLNHDMATMLKTSLHNKTLQFLVTDTEGEDYLVSNKRFKVKSPEEQSKLMLPYLQTSATQNEIIKLEAMLKDGYIKVYETGRNRKDRYVSLGMGNYFIKQKERELKKPKKKGGFIALW